MKPVDGHADGNKQGLSCCLFAEAVVWIKMTWLQSSISNVKCCHELVCFSRSKGTSWSGTTSSLLDKVAVICSVWVVLTLYRALKLKVVTPN